MESTKMELGVAQLKTEEIKDKKGKRQKDIVVLDNKEYKVRVEGPQGSWLGMRPNDKVIVTISRAQQTIEESTAGARAAGKKSKK